MSVAADLALGIRNRDADALDGLERAVIAVSGGVIDRVDDIHARHDLAENRVLGWGALVPEVKEGVVHGVDEELGSTRVGSARIGHG